MNIEQVAPKKPNFLLIVILSGLTILILFVLAYAFLDYDGKNLTFRHRGSHPTSQMKPLIEARSTHVSEG